MIVAHQGRVILGFAMMGIKKSESIEQTMVERHKSLRGRRRNWYCSLNLTDQNNKLN
jgi:hypothetical protein